MKNTTALQREQALAEFEAKQSKRYALGKLIVLTIAILNILFAVLSAVVNFNIFTLLIQIALSIALFAGVVWVRYLFAIGSALGALLSFYLLMVQIGDRPAWITVFLVIYMAFHITCCILLLSNKCVKDFLYAQKNG